MSDIYTLYKPLRNYLRKVDPLLSLGALRWYINYSQLVSPSEKPGDLEVHRDFWQNPLLMAPPWQLAFITRELIIEGQTGAGRDLRSWNVYGEIINKTRKLDDDISKVVVNQGNAFHYISKVLPHIQFVWQENRPNSQANTRYFCLFNDEPLRSIFENHFGISIEKYFAISSVMWGTYVGSLGITYPPTIQFNGKINNVDYDTFVKHYALPLDELRNRLKDPAERKMDESLPFYYDSLKKYPLIYVDHNGTPAHLCPIPTYLYWRTTEGIYYDLVDSLRSDQAKYSAFGNALGDSFGKYIGEILNDQPYNRAVTIVDADAKIAFGKPKPDWYVVDTKSAALIECKTKRLTLEAKQDMTLSPATEAQLTKLAESVIQVYKALVFSQSSNFTYLDSPKNWYPFVVTLENWYIYGDMKAQLDRVVHGLAQTKNVPTQTIADHPYLAISSDELENLCLVLRSRTLESVIAPFITDPKYSGWSFKTYLLQQFKTQINTHDIFQQDPLTVALSALTGLKLR